MSAIIKGAKIYFTDKKDLAEIFASPDGQYFYESGLCITYIRNRKLTGKPVRITKADFEAESAPTPPKAKVSNYSTVGKDQNKKDNGRNKQSTNK